MRVFVLTLFPEMVRLGLETSIIGKAIEKEILQLRLVNIRDFSVEKHQKVDDYPYGGGAGMVMQAQPIFDAWKSVVEEIGYQPRCIYLTPQGHLFQQSEAKMLAKEEDLIFLCGHYEGVDERVLEAIVTDYVSIGDYVLTGGELPAMVMIDAIARMVPGVLTNEASGSTESLEGGLLEYPQYSRPAEWMGKEVPPVLLSGDHKKVSAWQREQSLLRTLKQRPQLLEEAELSVEDVRFVLKQIANGKRKRCKK